MYWLETFEYDPNDHFASSIERSINNYLEDHPTYIPININVLTLSDGKIKAYVLMSCNNN